MSEIKEERGKTGVLTTTMKGVEAVSKEDIEKIFKRVKKVKPRPAWTGSPGRTPSDKPPVNLSPAKPQKLTAEPEKKVEEPVRKPRKKAAPPTVEA